jgi:NAD(P)-dependent dehydrogenase (short-subunit alcohol dehydrogenase family)
MTLIWTLVAIFAFCWVLWRVSVHYDLRARRASLRGRVVWVTGASSGIGRALAFRLAVFYGARVVVSARRVELLESLAAQVSEALAGKATASTETREMDKPAVVIEPVNLRASGNELDHVLQRVLQLGVSVVILNAGVNQNGCLFADTSLDTLREVLETNLWAPARILHRLLRELLSAPNEPTKASGHNCSVDVNRTRSRARKSKPSPSSSGIPEHRARLKIVDAFRDLLQTKIPASCRPSDQQASTKEIIASAPNESSALVENLDVVVVSSLAAYRALPGGALYGATKAALNYLTESLRMELRIAGDHRVRLVTVCPGFVDTPAIAHQRHWKPCCLSPDAAADHIIWALLRRGDHYGFPWIMDHVVMAVAVWIPTRVYRWIMAKSWRPPASAESAVCTIHHGSAHVEH